MNKDQDTELTTLLKVLGNPVRFQLLEELTVRGPATATELARRVGGASGSLSYHLRKLESAGLIESGESTDGRERRWHRTADVSTEYEQDSATSSMVQGELERITLRRALERSTQWTEERDEWEAGWVKATVLQNVIAHLTQEEFTQLGHELETVLDAWMDRVGGRAPGSVAGGRPCSLLLVTTPFPRRDQ